MTVGEGSNLFTVSTLRFLIYSKVKIPVMGHAELVSASLNQNGCPAHRAILKRVQDDGRRYFSLIIVLFLLSNNIFFASNASPADSLKSKYDLNDPRNSRCPCHQYQKLADEEYARLQNLKKDGLAVLSKEELRNSNKNFGKQTVLVNSFWFYHKKRKFSGKKERSKGHRIMKRRISDRLSCCFHF